MTSTNSPPPAQAVTWRPYPFRPVPHRRASAGAKVERNPPAIRPSPCLCCGQRGLRFLVQLDPRASEFIALCVAVIRVRDGRRSQGNELEQYRGIGTDQGQIESSSGQRVKHLPKHDTAAASGPVSLICSPRVTPDQRSLLSVPGRVSEPYAHLAGDCRDSRSSRTMGARALCWPQVAQMAGERQGRNVLDSASASSMR